MNTILMSLIIMTMTYEMPKLPYANNALEPVISQQTIDFHYGKHLQTYVNNLNSLVPGTEYEGKTVEEIVASAPDGAIFNNAGQVLNDCCCIEFFLEVLEATEVTFDCFSQFASGFFLRRFRGELQEVQIVVQYLSRIIEYSSVRC